MPEELKLVECLAKARKLPFTVNVSTGGGEYREGDVLEVTAVGHRAAGRAHEGEVTYAFTNKTTGNTHRDWRHDSSARFQLLDSCCCDELPAELQEAINGGGFCEQDAVEEIVRLILKEIKKSQTTPAVQ